MTKCIMCEKNDVTWPKVCDDCKDHEAQAEIAARWDYDESGTCHYCGMWYDGGQTCNYCGSTDPLEEYDDSDDWEEWD